jgi:hypothetical protein
LACLIVGALLSACGSFGLGSFGFGEQAVPRGEALGAGGVKVALLLPRSASGNGAETARAFRNAAELALRDFPSAGNQITVYDTK